MSFKAISSNIFNFNRITHIAQLTFFKFKI